MIQKQQCIHRQKKFGNSFENSGRPQKRGVEQLRMETYFPFGLATRALLEEPWNVIPFALTNRHDYFLPSVSTNCSAGEATQRTRSRIAEPSCSSVSHCHVTTGRGKHFSPFQRTANGLQSRLRKQIQTRHPPPVSSGIRDGARHMQHALE